MADLGPGKIPGTGLLLYQISFLIPYNHNRSRRLLLVRILVPRCPFRSMSFREVKRLALDTFGAYSAHNGERLAAALAYYATFSLAPLIVLALAIAGLLYGRRSEVAQEELMGLAGDVLGAEGAVLLEGVLEGAAAAPTAGVWATILSTGLLVVGATALFARLQEALNTIWNATPQYTGVTGFLRKRGLSLLLVIGAGAIVVASLLISSFVAGLVTLPGGWVLIRAVERLGSLVVLAVLFAVLYRALPDAHVHWSDVWGGAVMAAILVTLGTWGVGWYLGRASVLSSYGAAGALAAFLLWIYYSAQIFFLGAELTAVRARRVRGGRDVSSTPSVVTAASPLPESSHQGPERESCTPRWVTRLGWIGVGIVLGRFFGK